jgi:ApaG protein
MNSKISGGVQITAEPFYQPEESNPVNGEFVFAYRITIENKNDFPVKLLRRHWHIFDSNGEMREVEGEGVVGIQPVILPSNSYKYISGCHLKSEMGKMQGSYLLENLHTKNTFQVIIPPFNLIAPLKLN